MEKRDYYEVLGVDKNASEAEIKSAFRKLLRSRFDVTKPKITRGICTFMESDAGFKGGRAREV